MVRPAGKRGRGRVGGIRDICAVPLTNTPTTSSVLAGLRFSNVAPLVHPFAVDVVSKVGVIAVKIAPLGRAARRARF